MFENLPTYPEMRPSGLSWVESLPAHWGLQRAKQIMRAIDLRSADGDEELLTVSSRHGVIPRSTATVNMFKAETYVGHKLCWPDDLVINSLWAWGRGLGVARHHGIVSTAYGVYRQRNSELDPAYLHHLVRSDPFQWELQVRSQGVWKSRLQITDQRWLDAPMLLPPAEEQAAIVKYLAHANARIDKAVSAKRRLIALIEEQKRSAVAHQLTSGGRISPLRSMDEQRDLLPEDNDWRFVPTGRFCRISTGVEDSGNAQEEGQYPFYVRGREILRANEYLFDTEAVLTPGDGQGGVGKVFHYFKGKFQAHQRVYVFHDFRGVEARYFYWYLSSFFRSFALSKSNTVTMESLRRPVLSSFPVLMPGLSEQKRIVKQIESAVMLAEKQVEVTKREITLLQEFRARLVADVVMGQVDVRAIAATLPDAPESSDIQISELDDGLEEALSESEK